jgi:hypothetical protein
MKNKQLNFKLISISSQNCGEYVINSHEKKHLAIIEMDRLYNNGTFNHLVVRDTENNVVGERIRKIV